jgi:pimeloyl-ACP methyl ester carboxylesterase
MTPNTGAYDESVIAASLSSLLDKIGKGILITHSQGGGPGWRTALQNSNVAGIVSYEPGSGFVFPEGEAPNPLPTISPFGELSAATVPLDDFMKLTKFPIIIYYGDNIPSASSDNWAMDSWRVRLQMARLFVECVNRHGGDAKVIHLPEVGIKGNTHFPFAEKNNVRLADILSNWMNEKKLDIY